MAKRFILHVGFHKTGTTAIQASLYAAKSELEKFDITYAARASHGAAWALTEKVWGWRDRGGRLTPNTKWKKFVKKTKAAKSTFLASSEFFTELTPEQIQKLKHDVKAEKYEIIFTIRPLAKMLASSYQQYLKYGVKANYEKWLHEMLDEPGASKATPSFWRRNFHGQAIQKWADEFGAENITVIVVDETKPEFLYDAFTKYLGLPDGLLVAQETGANRSLTAEEVTMLQMLNKRFPKERAWDDYSVFIRQTAIRRLSDQPAQPSGTKLLTPEWAVEKAKALTEQAVKEIIAAKVNVIGDLQSLNSVKVPTGEPKPAEFIPVETMVEALLAFEQGVIRKMRWRVVLGEFARRLRRRVFGKVQVVEETRE